MKAPYDDSHNHYYIIVSVMNERRYEEHVEQ